MRQELLRRRIEQGPSRRLAAASGAYPARFHQYVERALGNLDSADRLDLGPADRFVIGDDCQSLQRGAAEMRRRFEAKESFDQFRQLWCGSQLHASSVSLQAQSAVGESGV